MSRKISLLDACRKYEVTDRTIHRQVREKGVQKFTIFSKIMYNDEQLSKIFRPELERDEMDIAYEDVDWTLANCRGVGTDLFFLEEEHLKHKGLEFFQVRAVCFSCPIRKQCLEWAFASKEEYGMLGGVSGNERRAIFQEKYDSDILSALKYDLTKFGVDFDSLIPASKAVKRESLTGSN